MFCCLAVLSHRDLAMGAAASVELCRSVWAAEQSLGPCHTEEERCVLVSQLPELLDQPLQAY